MLDKESAKHKVQEIISRYKLSDESGGAVIIDEATIEKDYGWIFFYQSKKFIETQDMEYMLFGNLPFVVEKSDGSITKIRISFPMEDSIKEYEAQRNK
jgi:Immunity protein 35